MIDRLLEGAATRHTLACLLLAALVSIVALPGFAGLFPMDRDEPRFAQASKQMLETGDFVNIRFHDEARNKKPVGIYWMQAASVSLGERLGVPEARGTIALYRVPSLLGALSAVLLTYWTGLALTARRGALLGAALMAPVLILVVEAHLAKTDAVLCATVVAAMAVLARAWMTRVEARPLAWPLCLLFWTAIATGILVKGPITPMVPLFSGLVLSLRERSGGWLLRLRPGAGLPWCLLLVLPWFVLILKSTGAAFLSESVGHDMAGKVAGAQEQHGAPPGAYLAAFWLTAWPLAPFALVAAPVIWRERRTDAVAFLLVWLIPVWLLFEAVPTKLPHYVLPTYPAVALLCGIAAARGFGPVRGWRLGLFGALLALVPLCLPVALTLANGRAASGVPASTIGAMGLATATALLCAVLSASSVRRDAAAAAVGFAALAAVPVYGFILGWFMNETRADLLAVSPRLASSARSALDRGCRNPGYATVGDREPSLVFETGTALLMTDAPGAAAFMAGAPCRVAFVTRPDEAAFTAALGQDPRVRLASRVEGLNINGGKRLDIGVYVRQEDAR